jgi:hypothetical protein
MSLFADQSGSDNAIRVILRFASECDAVRTREAADCKKLRRLRGDDSIETIQSLVTESRSRVPSVRFPSEILEELRPSWRQVQAQPKSATSGISCLL